MRIQNIKNGHNTQMAVFTTACFPPSLLDALPAECICRNTINVTFAGCLLAFYLNGIHSGWLLARLLLPLLTVWVPPVYKVALVGPFLRAPDRETGKTTQTQWQSAEAQGL